MKQLALVRPKAKNAQVARRLVKFAVFFNVVILLTIVCALLVFGVHSVIVVLLVAAVVNVPALLYAVALDLPFV